MEEFIDYAKAIMGTLGKPLFEPVSKPATKTPEGGSEVQEDINNLHLVRTIKNLGKVEASGAQTAEGFAVFKGSIIALKDDNTIPDVIKERRKNANGLTSWKDEHGKTLKSLESTDAD